MATKAWKIDVGGQSHVVEVNMGSFVSGGGNLSLDGKILNKWNSVNGLPSKMSFDIQGKKAEIKRKGFLNPSPVLYLEGKEVSSL